MYSNQGQLPMKVTACGCEVTCCLIAKLAAGENTVLDADKTIQTQKYVEL